MAWDVEYTDELGEWWDGLNEEEQISVDAHVRLLERNGPLLGFPYTSNVKESMFSHMRELRIQHQGKPIRILYAFDPRRCAILLIGGYKIGNNRWYIDNIPLADKLYRKHLASLEKEGLIDG